MRQILVNWPYFSSEDMSYFVVSLSVFFLHLVIMSKSDCKVQGGADKSLARPRRKQRWNSGFIQHNPHEAQYIS